MKKKSVLFTYIKIIIVIGIIVGAVYFGISFFNKEMSSSMPNFKFDTLNILFSFI